MESEFTGEIPMPIVKKLEDRVFEVVIRIRKQIYDYLADTKIEDFLFLARLLGGNKAEIAGEFAVRISGILKGDENRTSISGEAHYIRIVFDLIRHRHLNGFLWPDMLKSRSSFLSHEPSLSVKRQRNGCRCRNR